MTDAITPLAIVIPQLAKDALSGGPVVAVGPGFPSNTSLAAPVEHDLSNNGLPSKTLRNK